MAENNSEQEKVHRLFESMEGLVREIENLRDPAARAACKQLVQSLMEVHASGLERILEIIHRSGTKGQQLIDELGSDELTGNLLVLHGLHPLDLRTRVAKALEETRPYLSSHGGHVELIDVADSGTVTVRIAAAGHGCSSPQALATNVEQAIYAGAPDVTAVLLEGVQESLMAAGFVPLAKLQPVRNASGVNIERSER